MRVTATVNSIFSRYLYYIYFKNIYIWKWTMVHAYIHVYSVYV